MVSELMINEQFVLWTCRDNCRDNCVEVLWFHILKKELNFLNFNCLKYSIVRQKHHVPHDLESYVWFVRPEYVLNCSTLLNAV